MSLKSSSLQSADDPLTDVDYTGSSVNFLDFDDELTTDIDLTGSCVSYMDSEDDLLTDVESSGTSVSYMDTHADDDAFSNLDAQSEGLDSSICFMSPQTLDYDPLASSVEQVGGDDTGICLHYLDSLDDPTTEISCSGRSVTRIDEDEDDDEYTTDVDVTGRGVENLIK